MDKMILRFSSVIIVFIISMRLISCTSTEPDLMPEKTYPPGPRNYTWEIDTLAADSPTAGFNKMWGSSASDVWIVGPVDLSYTVLHYNGSEIENLSPSYPAAQPWSVYGFGSNNVWIGSENLEFWHYNGTNLTMNTKLAITGYTDGAYADIWGSNSNDIYMAGSLDNPNGNIDGIIAHFNGSKWSYSIQPVSNVHFFQIRKDNYGSKYYLTGLNYSNNSYGFYELDGNSVINCDVGATNSSIFKYIALMDGTLYFVNEKRIYKLWKGSINEHISFAGTLADGIQIWGRNENDFFIKVQGGIGHYNGQNLEKLFDIETKFAITEGVVYDNDVFFLGSYWYTDRYFLIHGILNDN